MNQVLPEFRSFWKGVREQSKPEHHFWITRAVAIRHGRATALRHSYPATAHHPKDFDWDKALVKARIHAKRSKLRKSVGDDNERRERVLGRIGGEEQATAEAMRKLQARLATMRGGAPSDEKNTPSKNLGSTSGSESVGAGTEAKKDVPPNSRWITVHPNGESSEGIPVLVVDNPDGTHTIVGGAGGSLNGMKLSGIRSPEDYAKEAKQRVVEKRKEKALREEQLRSQMGQQAYEKLQSEREAGRSRVVAEKKQSEQSFIEAVAKLQGADLSQFDVPKESLAGVDPKIVARLQDKTHEKKLAWANAIASGVKDIALAAYEDIGKDALGDIALSDVAKMSTGDTGKGYQVDLAHMAALNGFTTAGGKAIAQDTSMRGFLERSDHNLDEAKAKMESVRSLHEGARASHAEVKRVAQQAGAEDTGPEAISRLDTTPKVENVGQAVDILKAHAQMKSAQNRAKVAMREIAEVDDAAKIPKSLLAVTQPMDESAASKAVADALSQQGMTDAMMRIVGATNDMEGAGTLQAHYSIGQAAAINTVAQAVNGTTIDPLVMDTIGVAACAQALANQWRESMPAEEFDQAKRALVKQHVATQEKIANEGVSRAEHFTTEAQKIPLDAQPESPEEVEAVLSALTERTSLLRMARESAGIARGRLEAAGAMNFAMMKGKPGNIRVSMGAVSSADAAERLFAIGLNDPSKYDQTGEMTHEGDFTLHSDGTNRILELHPAGQRKLVAAANPETAARAARSEAIKSGKKDEAGWIPQGLINGPQTTFEMDPLIAHSIDHPLDIAEGDDLDGMVQKLKVHIGAKINEGRDPLTVLSDINAAGTAQGFGISDEAQNRYLQAVQAVAPPYKGKTSGKEFHAGFDAHRESLIAKLNSYADDHVADQKAKGVLSADEAALDRQRVPTDNGTRIDLLQAVAADPRTQNAFLPLAQVNMDAVRSYVMEHVLKVDPNDYDILSKVTPEQTDVFRQWEGFKKQHGANGVYAAIQEEMKQRHENDGAGLFGDAEPVSSLATVDLGNPLSILAAAKENGAALGYKKQVNPQTGEMDFLELIPGMKLYDPAKKNDAGTTNTEVSIAKDAKGRIRSHLRKYYIGTVLGRAAVAESGFNPESVVTVDNRWDKFKQHMGGTSKAVRAVQEFMAGDVAQRFGNVYRKRTGAKINMAFRPIQDAERYTEARMNPEAIEARQSQSRSTHAQVANRDERGRLAKEREGLGRKDKAEQIKQAESEQSRLIGETEARAGTKQVNVHRATLGRAIEGTLRGMMPYLPIDKPVDASQGVQMSGDFVNRQRGTKLILENERQGLNLGAGSGKSVCFLGAFTQARKEGKARKALMLVPSNIVGQLNAEFTKFVDPSEGLRWHADPGASGEENGRALADPDTHMVVMTPESLREHVTASVAKHLGVMKQEAAQKMVELQNEDLDVLLGDALKGVGGIPDFQVHDEGHKLLSRQGKPDARMSQIADSLSRQARHFVYSTADIQKNDSSECWSALNKIAPDKYPPSSQEAFQRKYGRNTVASGIALRKEMEPYIYADKVEMGVEHNRNTHVLPLGEKQAAEYAEVTRAARTAKQARAKGDMEGLAKALAVLSPGTDFKDAETVQRMAKSIGTLTDAAMNRVVNLHSAGVKLDWTEKYIDSHRDEPSVIFAHNLEAVKAITKRLQDNGHKVGMITGEMSTKAKDKAKEQFMGTDPKVNVLVCSDASAMGSNLQRGYHFVNYDTPQTSMLHEQRIARLVRCGQKNAVDVHDLVGDCGFDRRNRKRLERKAALRELMTSPSELVDDSGLSARLQAEKVYDALDADPEAKRAS